MLEGNLPAGALVLAIPAGGVPVGAAIAGRLGLALDVAVVSKITLPWNTEVGYGAVAFDGTVRLNQGLLATTRLTDADVSRGVAATTDKVKQRVSRFRGAGPAPDFGGRTAILVDDGLASGFTMRVAVEALRNCGAEAIVVAVPTGPVDPVRSIAAEADEVYCANVREGHPFAVADAYRNWRDVTEDEAAAILASLDAG
jgi:predicted phosphoribosyltransferase